MTNCYCANYYGSINCRNMVNRFGERCRLCLALNSGASLSNDLLPDELRWLDSPEPQEPPSRKTSRANSYESDRSDRSDQSSAGRSMRMGGGKY